MKFSKKKIAEYIMRYFFTLSLIYASYKETGPWTAVCLFLIFAAVELNSIVIQKVYIPEREDIFSYFTCKGKLID